jgi:adenylate cyclase class IV
MCTWFFEKRRREYRRPGGRLVLAIDEIPELGHFLEIEGPLEEVRDLRERLEPCVGPVERRNYRELFIDYKSRQGFRREEIQGAEFSPSNRGPSQ